jgi:phosphoserine aminotransferase
MSQHFEFSAGPGVIDSSVLLEAQQNLVDFKGAGRSIMEMSHRGKIVTQVAQEAEADLRELLNVPDTHAILFAQGGATTQFAAIPLNLCGNEVVIVCCCCCDTITIFVISRVLNKHIYF